jgi:hypothetical protein
MNIFYLDENPKLAATMLCDQHIRKMQIESAQMCCTAHWETNSEAPYKRAHKNHPSTIWARESLLQYLWLVEHGLEICNEFTKRYKNTHKTEQVLLWLKNNLPDIPDNGFKEPPLCMPDIYKTENTIMSYRKFYIEDKIKIKKLNWNKLNNIPLWVLEQEYINLQILEENHI